MKALKHLALAALVVAGLLLPSAVTRPRPASADIECDAALALLIPGGIFTSCVPYGTDDQPCTLNDVNVGTLVNPEVIASANDHQHGYTYDVNCNTGGGSVHVNAAYDFDTGKSVEYLRSKSFNLSATWICTHDPWIEPGTPLSCTRTGVNGSEAYGGTVADIEGIDLSQQDGVPWSVGILDEDGRRTLLFAQIQYLAKQAEAAKQAAAAAEAAKQAAAAAEAAKQAAIHAAIFTTTTTLAGSGAAAYSIAYHDPTIGADGWPKFDPRTQGETVKSLQYLLQGQGQPLGVSGVDGKFNPDTSAAVLNFQKTTPGLPTDGIVGQSTWLALIVTVDSTVSPDVKVTAAVKAVQSQLNTPSRLSTRAGAAVTVDGNFGSQTDAAVRTYQQAYQKAHPGFTVDGQVGPQTWQPLLVGS